MQDVTFVFSQRLLFGPLLFSLCLKDLPEALSHAHNYGYADDYKKTIHVQQRLHDATAALGNWLEQKQMPITTSKTETMNIKVNMTVTLQGSPVQISKSQKNLVIVISICLHSADKSNKRCSKGLKDLYQKKRSLSKKAHFRTKLIAYLVSVLQIVTYASHDCMPNKTNREELEDIQRKATSWIFSTNVEYKETLCFLWLLSLCCFVEMHDLHALLRQSKWQEWIF